MFSIQLSKARVKLFPRKIHWTNSRHRDRHLHSRSEHPVTIPERIHLNGVSLPRSHQISVLVRIGIQHEWRNPQGNSVLYELIDVIFDWWINFSPFFVFI